MDKKTADKKVVRSYTATPQELKMLETLAEYHGFSKSGTIRNLVKKEFWRVFPGGTEEVRPVPGAKVAGDETAPKTDDPQGESQTLTR